MPEIMGSRSSRKTPIFRNEVSFAGTHRRLFGFAPPIVPLLKSSICCGRAARLLRASSKKMKNRAWFWALDAEPNSGVTSRATLPRRPRASSYYRARYYDPSTGRFVSEDPIGFISSANFYDYVDNNPIDLADPIGNDPCLDINKFVNNLNHNAHQSPSGWCGRHIYWALKAGGLGKVGSLNGKDFGQPLVENGFTPESPDNYEPQPGDIAVIQPYPGGNQAGHVEGWNGSQWVSDFFQPYRPNLPGHGIYPGPGYRKFQPPFKIYRPTPCPTSPPAEQDLLQGMITWIANLFD